MALQAFLRIHRRCPFGRAHFMAGRAGHLRILVAAASLRQRHLITVDTDSSTGVTVDTFTGYVPSASAALVIVTLG
jgi:hypothetical protein